jgi:pimeloyl-ACP methyl ester carboxylesterase
VTAIRTTTVDVEGGRLEADVLGDGPSVVLLHPGLWDRRTWDDQLETFSADHRVVRYDLRGYGRSTRPQPGRPYSHVEDLVAVLDALGIDRAALVGCSMGGRIALDATLEHPGRVGALVLAAPAVSGFTEGTADEEAWEEDRRADVDAAIEAGDVARAMDLELERFAALLGTGDPIGARIRAIAMDNVHERTMDESAQTPISPPALERLEDVAVPTLVLPAEHDPPYFDRLCGILTGRIPDARLVRIPGTDHVVNMRQPSAFDEVVLRFLAEVWTRR